MIQAPSEHSEPGDPAYLPISDYGIIGTTRTIALVGRNGSIDWCCMPDLDSPSVFAALLDHRRGGRFQITHRQVCGWEQRYLEGTNVLETTLQSDQGRICIVDFMPLRGQLHRADRIDPAPEIHRIVTCDDGEVDVLIEWSPRFDYARASTHLSTDSTGYVAAGGSQRMALLGVPPDAATMVANASGPAVRAEFRMRAGQQMSLVARYGPAGGEHRTSASLRACEETVQAWRDWVHVCEPEEACSFAGRFHRLVVRSGLALKLLTHPHTGAIAAAPTTSLPEQIGGVRNWDYRFAWIRDASFVSQALFALGHRSEARDFLHWLPNVAEAGEDQTSRLQILFGLHGETELPELELEHLEGYRGSRPVRIGNAAVGQLQLDIYGELINAAYELTRMGGDIAPRIWRFLAAVADQACSMWRKPDRGIWEVRGEPRHFVYSKVQTWVVLDRAIRLAEHYRLAGNLGNWRRERAAIRRAVLEEGFDPELGSFARSFGSKALDAANLLIPIVDFLPPEDLRVKGTIDQTIAHLTENGLVRRYLVDDGLSGGEGTFLLCTFWLVNALALSGRLEEAHEVFEGIARRSNHLGLYSEEIDARTGEFLGNFPQAFSHAGVINSALYLARAEGRYAPAPPPMGSPEHRIDSGENAAV